MFDKIRDFSQERWRALTSFIVKSGDDEIKQFYMTMRRQSPQPRLYIKRHKIVNNIECMIATDLAAGFNIAAIPNQPEHKATLFLQNMAGTAVLGLEPTFLKESIFLQQTIQSDLGTHTLFGLRHQGQILGENCFAVHLDNDQRVVMLYAVYQRFMGVATDGLETVSQPQSRSIESVHMERLLKEQDGLTSAYVTDAVLAPAWSSGLYQPYQEVKVTTEAGSFIWLVDDGGYVRHKYTIDADITQARVGHIWDDVWYGDLQQAKRAQTHTKKVVLRDLHSTLGHLEGRYVKLEDQINKKWKPKAITLESDPKTDSSLFDRTQAYYHIDRIQRYFRDLGLTVLDDFSALNPLRVALTKSSHRRTSYTPNEKSIYLKQIVLAEGEGQQEKMDWQMDWTDARDSMTIYHEYVHAVTDALAMLRHQDSGAIENPRYRDMLQAAAMDEGMADYFACSLAVGDGAEKPRIGILRQTVTADREIKLAWKLERDLAPQPNLQLVHQQSTADLAGRENDLIYEWGEQWGRFLWNLRSHEAVGAEVADRLIAHSILYLTRWSSFNIGVLAILLADQLIFGGSHRAYILAVSALNIKQISEKPTGPLADMLNGEEDWFQIDFGISGSDNHSEDSSDDEADLEPDIDPYLVDEWVMEGDEPIKIRHKVEMALQEIH